MILIEESCKPNLKKCVLEIRTNNAKVTGSNPAQILVMVFSFYCSNRINYTCISLRGSYLYSELI